ncbi:uncharacterized protein LOC121270591 [Carcharodon carcharias]|uniref:uncharacterized protein LOC121270591 n=1 Tax=Carcharodon carcharias TaxID=13397 RepID=UPI001B7F1F44|nr:uncharacterized protein LOC121270591 [Carcharodon carcharias]
MRLVERTLCLGALRITSNLACSKESVFTQSVSGQTIVLLLFTDVCVTGYLFICWFADLQLPNGQEVISLRFTAFLNETYNAVTLLILALIVAETHFSARPQRMPASAKCQVLTHPAPANHLLPRVNGVYVLLCWTIAASYGARYYPDNVRIAHQCTGGHPLGRFRCLRSFHLPDPFLALVQLLVVTSYIFCRGLCTDGSEARHPVPLTTVSSGPPLSGDASCLLLKGSHLQTTCSPQSPATQPGYLLTGLVATLMLLPGLPYLGLTSPLISCFEHLSQHFFAQLSKCSQYGMEPMQPGPYRLIRLLLHTSQRKGRKLLENTGRREEEISLPVSSDSK